MASSAERCQTAPDRGAFLLARDNSPTSFHKPKRMHYNQLPPHTMAKPSRTGPRVSPPSTPTEYQSTIEEPDSAPGFGPAGAFAGTLRCLPSGAASLRSPRRKGSCAPLDAAYECGIGDSATALQGYCVSRGSRKREPILAENAPLARFPGARILRRACFLSHTSATAPAGPKLAAGCGFFRVLIGARGAGRLADAGPAGLGFAIAWVGSVSEVPCLFVILSGGAKRRSRRIPLGACRRRGCCLCQ